MRRQQVTWRRQQRGAAGFRQLQRSEGAPRSNLPISPTRGCLDRRHREQVCEDIANSFARFARGGSGCLRSNQGGDRQLHGLPPLPLNTRPACKAWRDHHKISVTRRGLANGRTGIPAGRKVHRRDKAGYRPIRAGARFGAPPGGVARPGISRTGFGHGVRPGRRLQSHCRCQRAMDFGAARLPLRRGSRAGFLSVFARREAGGGPAAVLSRPAASDHLRLHREPPLQPWEPSGFVRTAAAGGRRQLRSGEFRRCDRRQARRLRLRTL